MPARLFCQTGELAGSTYTITKDATIGRLSQNEVTLFPNVISSQHARIFFDENEKAYFLEDLGSRNGTALDGIIVTAPTRLDGLNVITFANEFDFIFQDTERFAPREDRKATAPPAQQTPASRPQPAPPQAASPPRSAPPAEEKTRMGDQAFGALPNFGATPPPAKPTPPPAQPSPPSQADDLNKTRIGGFDALPKLGGSPSPPPQKAPPEEEKTRMGDQAFGALPNFGGSSPTPAPRPSATFFLTTTINGETIRFHLKPGDNTIGRTSSADLRMPDASISRQHAAITVREGRIFVRDVGSKNGTFLNNNRIDTEVELHPGATVRFGHQLEATVIKE